jgi:opacity protein-like surface antigen/outer membrane protein OmpA-like peptidoglycan-associated protein
MSVNTSRFATAALTILFMGGILLHAEAAASPSPGAKGSNATDSSSTTFAMPKAAMPKGGVGTGVHSNGQNFSVPRFELFVGYSYLRAVPTLANGNRFVWLNGGSTSLAYNFNRYLGLVGDFGGFNDTRLLKSANPSVVASSSGTAYTFLFGPRVFFRNHERITPFAQALFGGVHAGQVTISSGCAGVGCTPLPAETSFALTAGGGLDVNVHRHIAVRILQAEYLMTNLKNLNTGNSARQNDMRLSAGLVFRFGGSNPSPVAELQPVTYSCTVSPASVYPGDAIAVSGSALNLSPEKTAVYTWSSDGGTVTGTSGTPSIDTTSAAPGTYTVKGHVSEGDKASENADCSATYTVKAFEPPTVSCIADPTEVISGRSVSITATGISPQNRALTYSFSSSSGSVSGSGSTAMLATSGVPTGSITISCNVSDDKGQSASATTSVAVTAPVAAAKPVTHAQCPVSFARDARRPVRVDNEAKACLDQIAMDLQSDSSATLVLVGNSSGDEKNGSALAAKRAINSKAYLVNERGIDSARIALYTGSQDSKGVATTMVPADATFDSAGDTSIQ